MSDLIRIVKLPVQKDKIEEFKAIYNYGRKVVLASSGCGSLRLCRDTSDERIFFTISVWKDEKALNKYRSSKEFKSYWPKIKRLLFDKPKAFSLQDITKSVNRM